MPITSKDLISSWVFWLETTRRSDADQLVTHVDNAANALGRILHQGISEDLMLQWLHQWATEKGIERFHRLSQWSEPPPKLVHPEIA